MKLKIENGKLKVKRKSNFQFSTLNCQLGQRGDGYIDVVVAILVTTILLIFALNIFNLFTMKQEMDYFAKEMVEVACAEGQTDGTEVYNRLLEIDDELGYYIGYSWDTDYYQYSRVQLGDTIKITARYTTYVKGFGIFKIPLTLTVMHSGVSEHYWK
ncbi:MAG: DUF4320 family protein [Eubacteriales bacterium]|nr:DUF4320 family protein [Eubacteriales bacterium]